MRNSVGLSPFLVLVSLLLGGTVGGILGAIVAVPIVAGATVVLDRLQDREVPVPIDPAADRDALGGGGAARARVRVAPGLAGAAKTPPARDREAADDVRSREALAPLEALRCLAHQPDVVAVEVLDEGEPEVVVVGLEHDLGPFADLRAAPPRAARACPTRPRPGSRSRLGRRSRPRSAGRGTGARRRHRRTRCPGT